MNYYTSITKQGIFVMVSDGTNPAPGYWEADVEIRLPNKDEWHTIGMVSRKAGPDEVVRENSQLNRFLSEHGDDESDSCLCADANTTNHAAVQLTLAMAIEKLADSVGIPELVRRFQED